MDFQVYLGIVAIVIGLAWSAREAARRQRAAALSWLLISLQGALLVVGGTMDHGGVSLGMLAGIIIIGLAVAFAASRLSRKQGG